MEGRKMSSFSSKVYTVWADGRTENYSVDNSRIDSVDSEKLEGDSDRSTHGLGIDIRGLGIGYANYLSHSYAARWKRFATIALVVWATAATAIAIGYRNTAIQAKNLSTQESPNGETGK
jgi:hypothetical protein